MSRIEQTITAPQSIKYEDVCKVLALSKHSPNIERLTKELQRLGLSIVSRRVTWSGGVGSCKLMRGGVLRVQVRASTWAYKDVAPRVRGRVAVQGSRSLGYKYAPCVEIAPDGSGFAGCYYRSGSQQITAPCSIKEQHHPNRKKIFSHL